MKLKQLNSNYYNTDELNNINSDVKKLADIFKEFDELVNKQDEKIDIIENNISKTEAIVEESHTELVVAEKTQTKNRKLKFIFTALLTGVIAGPTGFIFGSKAAITTVVGIGLTNYIY